jgi:hypothetical protein
VLAALSTVWGTTRELSVKTDTGKTLTRPGYVAVGITVLGLLISVISNVLSDQEARKRREGEIAAEVRRTQQIILASQPLTSLDLEWSFSELRPSVRTQLTNAEARELEWHQDMQRDVGREEGQEINRSYVMWPTLLALARDAAGSRRDESRVSPAEAAPSADVLVLIGLDDDRNTMLSFGKLDPSVQWNNKAGSLFKGVANALSGAISFCQDYYTDCLEADSYRAASRKINSWPIMSSNQLGSARIRWSLDPDTLTNSIDRQAAAAVATARLPTTLRIAILFDIRNLPFDSGNLAKPLSRSMWTRSTKQASDQHSELLFASTLRLVANNIVESTYEYGLENISETEITDDDYGEEVFNARCLLLTYELQVGLSPRHSR